MAAVPTQPHEIGRSIGLALLLPFSLSVRVPARVNHDFSYTDDRTRWTLLSTAHASRTLLLRKTIRIALTNVFVALRDCGWWVSISLSIDIVIVIISHRMTGCHWPCQTVGRCDPRSSVSVLPIYIDNQHTFRRIGLIGSKELSYFCQIQWVLVLVVPYCSTTAPFLIALNSVTRKSLLKSD